MTRRANANGDLAALDRELAEVEFQIGGIKDHISDTRAKKLISVIKRTSYHKGEVYDLTPTQYRRFFGKEPKKVIIRRGKIPWEYCLDELATELGYRDEEQLKKAIEDVAKQRKRLQELEAEQAGLLTEIAEMKGKESAKTSKKAALRFAKKRILIDGKVTAYQITSGKATVGYIVAFPPTYGIYESSNGLDIRKKAIAGHKSIKKAKETARQVLRRD